MATVEQIKALIKAHYDDNDEQFKVVALQIAAHEARLGHSKSAQDIKNIINSPLNKRSNILRISTQNQALNLEYPKYRKEDLVLDDSLFERIERILREYRCRDVLRKNGLKNRSKLLLEGEPGTGKTMTASVIANELKLPLFSVQPDRLISKYMGETSVKLKTIFDQINDTRGVYLFDEFDAIGADRTYDNDVGEMRRILNSLLQYIEADDSNSIIIAATNNADMLDKALFRRFDEVLAYHLPDKHQIKELLKKNLDGFLSSDVLDPEVIDEALGLNHAEIVKACDNAMKESILNEQIIDKKMMINALNERKRIARYKEA